MRLRVFIVAVAILALGAGAYFLVEGLPGRGPKVPPPPDLAGVETAVAQKILSVHAELENSPTEVNWARYGRTLVVHGRAEAAVRAFLVAAELASDPFQYYYNAGIAVRHRDTARTIGFFEKALSYNDRYMPLHVYLGESYLAVDRLEEAEVQFEAARKMEGTSHSLLGLGRVALRRNDVPAAIDFLERARKKNPRHREVLVALASAYSRAGSIDKARQAAAEAREAPDRTPLPDPILNRVGDDAASYHAFHTRALNLFTSGRSEEAIPLIEKALEIRPGYPDALFLRAQILLAAGQPERAGRSIDQYLTSQRNVTALHLKVNCLYKTGKFMQAGPFLREIYKLDPENVEARYLLAALLLQAGKSAEGESHLQFVIKQQPGMTKAHVLYGRFLLENGRKEEAKIEAQKALEQEPENQRARLLLEDIKKR